MKKEIPLLAFKGTSNEPSYNKMTKHIDTAPVPGAKGDSNTLPMVFYRNKTGICRGCHLSLKKIRHHWSFAAYVPNWFLTVRHGYGPAFGCEDIPDRKKVPNRDRF